LAAACVSAMRLKSASRSGGTPSTRKLVEEVVAIDFGVAFAVLSSSRICSAVVVVVSCSASSVCTRSTRCTPPFRSSPSLSCLAASQPGSGR
jgi:hypothetical protein